MPRLLLLCLPLLLAGCGDSKPTPYPVSGTVKTADGKPATGAILTFHPDTATEQELRFTGIVDDRGAFQMTTFNTGDGAPAGSYTITLIWPNAPKRPMEPPSGDRLNGKYASKENSQLKFTVEKKDRNEVPPIVVK